MSLWLLGLSFFLRLAQAMTVGAEVLGDHEVLANLWLLPLRDAIAMGLWVAGFAGNTIVWRGERFALKDGKLVESASGSFMSRVSDSCRAASASQGLPSHRVANRAMASVSMVRHAPSSLKSFSQRGRSSASSAVSA